MGSSYLLLTPDSRNARRVLILATMVSAVSGSQ